MSIIKAAGAGEVSTGFYGFEPAGSLRVEDSRTMRMYHNTVAGSQRKITLSYWIKAGDMDFGTVWSSWNGTSNFYNNYFSPDGNYSNYFASTATGSFVDYNFVLGDNTGDMRHRDPGAWKHYCIAIDTEQATAADRHKVYINGVQQTAVPSAASEQIPQNYDIEMHDSSGQTFLFHNPDSSSYYASFTIAELIVIDGTQYEPTKFGEFKDGIWIPIDPLQQSLSFGNNGFYLNFADSSDPGKDVSGEGHHFTSGTRSAVVNNILARDINPDSPVVNFATLNPLADFYGEGSNTKTFTEGNLKVAQSGGGSHDIATIGIEAGNSQGYYWEAIVSSMDTARTYIGVISDFPKASSSLVASYSFTNKYVLNRNDDFYGNTDSNVVSYTAYAQGDIVMVAYKDGKIWMGVNGTWMNSGDPAGGTGYLTAQDGTNPSDRNQSVWLPYFGYRSTFIVNFGQNGTFCGTKTAQGNADENGVGDFYYSVPSGFVALTASHLPDQTISEGGSSQAPDYFKAVLWSGNSTNNRSITTDHATDWIWIKKRGTTIQSHVIADSVRGTSDSSGTGNVGILASNSTGAESTNSSDSGIASFDSTGFTIGAGSNTANADAPYQGTNASGHTYVGWSWRAGGTAVSNTDGSITSSVSANQDAGFSIVSYEGTGSNATVGHGLSSAPELIIIKERDNANGWAVSIKGDATDFLRLDQTTARSDDAAVFNDTAPTSSVFSIGTAAMVNRDSMIALCFHSVSGFSKVGFYDGNGVSGAGATFVYLGFRPAWVMIKQLSGTSGWLIYDNARSAYNPVNIFSQAQSTAVEANSATDNPLDFVSNGFKLRYNNSATNTSGAEYIYLAFAEQTLRFANGR